MSAQICKKIPKNQNGAAMPGKPSAFPHYNVPVGEKGSKLKKKAGTVVQAPMPRKKIVEKNPATISYPVDRATTINKKQAGGVLTQKNKNIYNSLNPGLGYDIPSIYTNTILYAAGRNKPRRGINIASPEEEAYWKKYITGEDTPGVVEPTKNRINYDKGDNTSDFVGVPSSMMERVAAMTDTLNLGKLVRDPEKFRTRFPGSEINYLGLKRMYEFGKSVMNNPGKGQQGQEDMTIKRPPSGRGTGLGALQNFGVVWDKENSKLKVYDTYDFKSPYNKIIPERVRPLKIRGEMPFNPKVGSTLLKNNFEQFDTIK